MENEEENSQKKDGGIFSYLPKKEEATKYLFNRFVLGGLVALIGGGVCYLIWGYENVPFQILVVDEYAIPLPKAKVSFSDTNTEALTNEKGIASGVVRLRKVREEVRIVCYLDTYERQWIDYDIPVDKEIGITTSFRMPLLSYYKSYPDAINPISVRYNY